MYSTVGRIVGSGVDIKITKERILLYGKRKEKQSCKEKKTYDYQKLYQSENGKTCFFYIDSL